MIKEFTLYAAAAAALAVAMPASAQPVAVERVAYQDLNLSRGRDQQQLRGRIEAAVQRVCPAGLEHPAALSDETVACRSEARRDARAKLGEAVGRSRAEPRVIAQR